MKGTMKKIVSILLALALVITSINYTPKTVSAADYTQLEYVDIDANTNAEFAASLSGSKIAVYSGPVTLNVKQYQNAGFGELYLACGGVSGTNFSATINGQDVTTEGTGIRMYNAATYLTYEYNVLEVFDNNGDSVVIIYCPANAGKGTYEEGTPEESSSEEVTEPEESSEEPSSEEESSEQPSTSIDWNAIAWAGNGTGNAANTDVYKFYAVDGVGALVNLQTPGWAAESGFYVTFPADVSSTTLSSYTTQGGGVVLGLSSFTAKETTFTVTLVNGNTYKCAVYYANGTEGEEEPTEEPTEPVEGTVSLEALEDAYVYNFVEAGEGYIVGFEDPNEDTIDGLPAETVYTYKYVLNINGNAIEVAKPGATVDLSELGLVEGTEYTVTMNAVYTDDVATVTSPASVATKFTYRNTASTVESNGIAQIFFTTSSNPTDNLTVTGLYTGNGSYKPKVPTAIVVKGADGSIEAFNYGTANVRGNSTANAAKKPYNFKFDKKKNLFEMGNAKKWSLLANLFDKTLMRNQIAMDFQRALEASQGTFEDGTSKVFTSNCQPVDLYIDGKYAGTYSLIESVEVGGDRVDIDIDGIDEDTNEIVDASKATNVTINGTTYQLFDVLLELGNDNRLDDEAYYFKTNTETFAINEPARENKDYAYEPTAAPKPEFVGLTQAYVTDFETALAANNYDLFSQYIDVDSFVDFYITAEYFMTKDIGFSSTRFYIRDGKLYAGPLWDLDLSSGNNGANPSAENLYAQGSFNWMRYLMANETFAAKVKERYKELQPQIKALYSTGGKVDQAYSTVSASAVANYTEAYTYQDDLGDGWGYTYVYGNNGYFDQAVRNLTIDQAYNQYGVYGTVTVYDNYADYITEYKTWLKDRNEWLLETWDITLDTGIIKTDEGDVTVVWSEVEEATGYQITYTPATEVAVADTLSLFGLSLFAASESESIELTAAEAAELGYSYNFTDNLINLSDNSVVSVAYTTDDLSSETVTYQATGVEEEVYSNISLLNRVTVDELNATIVTNVTNSGTAVAEDVTITLTDSQGNALDTKTLSLVGVGETIEVEWDTITESVAGTYTYSIQIGTQISSGVVYTCATKDDESLVWTELEDTTTAVAGTKYVQVSSIEGITGAFTYETDGFQINLGATDRGVVLRLNGATLHENLTGSALNRRVYYGSLISGQINEIQIEFMDVAQDMTTITTRVLTVYFDVPEETVPDTTGVDDSEWVEIPISGTNAAEIEHKYYVNKDFYTNHINTTIFGVYAPHSEGAYHENNAGDNCTLTGNAIEFSISEYGNKFTSMTAVWIDGVKYYDETTDVQIFNASLEMDLDKFTLADDAAEEVHYVTIAGANGAKESFAIKVTAIPPEAVKDLAYAGTDENPYVWTWTASESAVSYNVTVTDAEGNVVGETVSTSETTVDLSSIIGDENVADGTYTVSVIAVDELGLTSDASSIAYTKDVVEENPDITTVISKTPAADDTDGWSQPTGNDGSVINSTGKLTYYIATSYYSGGENNNGFFSGGFYGYYSDATTITYGGLTANTVVGEAFAFNSGVIGTGIDSVWLSDGTTFTKLNEGTEWFHSTTNNDVVTITSKYLVLPEGATEAIYYFTVRLDNGTDYSWPVKVASTGVTWTYTSTTAANDAGRLFPDTNENGNNYVRYSGVSATATSGSGDFAASSAIDNVATSRWGSDASDPQSITVDLGSVYTVKEIAMSWETASSKDYTILVSEDGDKWTEVAAITGAKAGANRVDSIVLDTATDARYVQMYATARTTGYGHSIWEMAIYGEDEVAAVETTTTESVETVDPITGLTWAGTGDLPYYWAWAASTADSYNIYINGEYVASTTASSYNGADYFVTAAAGTYTISVTAVKGELESTPVSVEYVKVAPETTTVADVEPEDELNILFIGNSFTYYNTICNVVQGLAELNGHTVNVTAATNGGQDLVYQATAQNVLDAIAVGGYDVVILQDKVGDNFQAETLFAGAEAVIEKVKEYNPDAEIMFYEPFPTRDQLEAKMSYFTYSYIDAAIEYDATLAPAGETFYDLYRLNGFDYYCSDDKHPQPLGTFAAAATIYYSLYPDEAYSAFTAENQEYLDELINTNVAYTEEGKADTYSLETLNLISSLGYEYARGVVSEVEGTGTYNSVAGTRREILVNPINGRDAYTFATSNVNNGSEGFLYVGNGFSAINFANENLTNGNNLLGTTATTEEVAVYFDLGNNYDVSKALIYQGSTNGSYVDSYCTNYSIYYSTEEVNATNEGDIEWILAGTCDNGSIYSGAQIASAENVSISGDIIQFSDTYTARSIKIVFDKESCMGTSTEGTVSLLSVQVYGTETEEELLDAPTNLSNSEAYTWTWDAVTDAVSYNVYVDGTLVGRTESTSYDLTSYITDKATYTISVEAANGELKSNQTSVLYTNGFTYNNLTGNTETIAQSYTFPSTKSVSGVTWYNYITEASGVSAEASSVSGTYTADLAIDGIVFANGNYWRTTEDTATYTVNLGSVLSISELDLVWDNQGAKVYDVLVSTDGQTWVQVADVTNGTETEERIDTITLSEAVQAQYVQFSFQEKTQDNNDNYNLREIAIYGATEVETIDAPTGLAITKTEETYTLEWVTVENAVSYDIYVNGELVGNSVAPNYDITSELEDAGEYTIGVVAVAESGLKSEMTTITYVVEEEETTTTLDPSTLTFIPINCGEGTEIEYAIVTNTLTGINVWYGDGGATFQISHQNGAASELLVNGEISEDGFVKNNTNGLLQFNPSILPDDSYTVVTATTEEGQEITFVIKKGTPVEETTTEEPGEPKPDVSGVQLPAQDGWRQVTGGVGAANDSKYYVPTNSTLISNVTELENKGSDVAYGGDANNPLTIPVFGFSVNSGTPESVWVTTADGTSTKLTSENSYINTNVISIAQSIFDVAAGEEEIFYVTLRNADGTDNTYPLKVVGEQPPVTTDVTIPAEDGWTQVTAGAGSADGSIWYLPTDTSVVTNNVRELENTGADVAYGGYENNTLTVPVLGFSVGTGWPKSIWVGEQGATSVKLTSEEVYLNTDVISVAQSLFKVAAGQTKIFYITARNADGSDHTFPVKIVGPEFEVTPDNVDWVLMPNSTEYYYYVTSEDATDLNVGGTTEQANNLYFAFYGTIGGPLASATFNGTSVQIDNTGVFVPKTLVTETNTVYVLDIVDPEGDTAKVYVKWEKPKSYAPAGFAASTDRGATDETTDDSVIVSWTPSADAVEMGCTYTVTFNNGEPISAVGGTTTISLDGLAYGDYPVVLTTYDPEGNVVDTQTITYKYLDPYAVDSTVNFNNTLWEKFRYQTVTWTKVEAAKEYAIYADGVLVGTTTDLTYNVDAFNYANGTNANGQATTVGAHTTTVVAVFEGDTVPESLDAVNTGRIMGTNDFALNVNYIYGKGTDKWNDSGVDSKWNFTVSEAVAGQISEGASVVVDYDATGAAELEIVDNGKHDGDDQEWTIKAAIYDEAILEGEMINLSFDILGPADLVGQKISIKCCEEEVDDNGTYTGEDAIYEEAAYTFKAVYAEDGTTVIGSVIHYSNSFKSEHDSYDLLFGLGELDATTLTLTDASATKVYGVTSVSASGIVNTENTADNSMYISWETNVPDLLKNYYTYTLKVYDADGNVVIEYDNAKSGTIYEGMNADLVAGTYRVEVSSVYDGTITATKETTATIDVNAALQPDLVISDISIVDPSIEYRIGDTVSFDVTMTNVGNADATITDNEIVLILYAVKDGTNNTIQYAFVPKTDGTATVAKNGGSITMRYSYTISDAHHSGDYLFTIKALADERHVITESNENNNEYSKIFMFNPALEVVSFANDEGVVSASWPATTDSTVASYLVKYTDSEGNTVEVNSESPEITLPDGTWFKNDSQVSVTALCNDGTEYLYAQGVARADLVIETMNPLDGVAIVGEKVSFVAIVRNIGVAPATAKEGSTQEATVIFTSGSMQGLYASDYVIGADNQPIYKTLYPNDTSTITLNSTYVPEAAGTEEYSALVDDVNRILESKDTVETAENNNTYTDEFIVLNPSDLELKLNEPEGEASYVSATWTDKNILDTSDPKLTVTGYKLTYTNAAGETITVEDIDKSLNTYVFTEELKNNTDVIITANYEEYGDDYIQIAKTKALADLDIVDGSIVITQDGVEVDIPATEREYQISFTYKNIGTAALPAALVPKDDPFLEYGKWILGNLQCSPEEGFECVATPANYNTEGILAGESDVITFESVTFNKEGDFTLTANIDYPGHKEAEEGGYITESNEDNNSETKDITVKFIQNTEMDWTRLVYDDGTGTNYLFPVASGSQDAYIDYKILTTTERNYHYEDIINKYVGYNGGNMSIGFAPDKTMVYFDGGDGTNHSYTKFEFAQVPNWNEFETELVYNEVTGGYERKIKLDENGDPIEITPDENSKELVWITLPDKASTIHDVSGTEGNLSEEIINTDVSSSPMGYNGNGYNFFVGNFGLYKCYLMKFTTPVPALDEFGNYTYDADKNMLFEYETVLDEDGNPVLDENGNPVKQLKYDELVVAFRVTDDTLRTNNWMQSLASDGVSNPNTLPIPYCGGDSYVIDDDGIENTVKDIIYADGENKHQIKDVHKSTVIDDTSVTDNEHEDTEASQNYETIGAIWYDASDILLSSVSVYNGNWLSIATSEYLEFSSGDQDNQGTKNLRVGIARATVDPAQNNKFVGYATDFVVTDPNKEGTHLGIQGTNTVHVGLPWLLEELPTHSDRVDANGNALPKDQEYYWIRVWADIEKVQETVIVGEGADREYKQLANYIDIPIVVYYDVPQIQPAQNVTAITSYDDNDQEIFSLSWGEIPEMAAYGYKYKVFYTNAQGEDIDISLALANSSGLDTSDYVEGTEYYFDSPQALTSNDVLYDEVATYDPETNTVTGSLKVVAYWCEQSIPVVVDIQPPHGDGWYSFDGESTINILAGQSKPVEINGYMSYYYNRSQNHSSGTIGYNGYFVSLNGNTKWFASNSKVSFATGTDSMFESRTDMTASYDGLYEVVDDNEDGVTGAISKDTVDAAEKSLGLVFKEIENPNEDGYVAGQLQIESKTLFQATNHVTWYLIKVETPILDGEGNETDDVRVAYIMMESIVEVGGDVAVRGFQINTDATPGAVSEYSTSFRVVSRASKLVADNTDAIGLAKDGINEDLGADKPLYAEGTLNSSVEAIVANGTLYTRTASVTDDQIMLNVGEDGKVLFDEAGNAVLDTAAAGVYNITTTEEGIFENWSGSVNDADKAAYTYYGLTVKPSKYSVTVLTREYRFAAYMITEEGDVIYEEGDNTDKQSTPYKATTYKIAETLYNNSLMKSEEDHEYLYNNVLNIVSIYYNYAEIGKAMLARTGYDEPSTYTYVNTAYKDLYYYAHLTQAYATDSYINRGTFISKTLVDGVYNEEKLLPILNNVKENSETDYATIADWIYNEIAPSIGFYRQVEYAPNTDSTVDAGESV